jgi:hypothetical protein
MNDSDLEKAIKTMNDGGSAQILAKLTLESGNVELIPMFLNRVLQKCTEGHHQTREFAIAGLKVLNETT